MLFLMSHLKMEGKKHAGIDHALARVRGRERATKGGGPPLVNIKLLIGKYMFKIRLLPLTILSKMGCLLL
jgi:hypothetical protein